MTTADAIAIIQTILAVGAFVFAYQEFKQWRVETLGNKKIDLAIRLGKAALAIRRGFEGARIMATFGRAPEYVPDTMKEDKYKQDQAYDFEQRLQRVLESVTTIYDIEWEIELLFKSDESIKTQVKAINAKYHELRNAMARINRGKGREEDDITLFGDIGEDKFAAEVEAITDKLLAIAYKYTR